jgi:hypothetical protein
LDPKGWKGLGGGENSVSGVVLVSILTAGEALGSIPMSTSPIDTKVAILSCLPSSLIAAQASHTEPHTNDPEKETQFHVLREVERAVAALFDYQYHVIESERMSYEFRMRSKFQRAMKRDRKTTFIYISRVGTLSQYKDGI